jgi:hypothetical protein
VLRLLHFPSAVTPRFNVFLAVNLGPCFLGGHVLVMIFMTTLILINCSLHPALSSVNCVWNCLSLFSLTRVELGLPVPSISLIRLHANMSALSSFAIRFIYVYVYNIITVLTVMSVGHSCSHSHFLRCMYFPLSL